MKETVRLRGVVPYVADGLSTEVASYVAYMEAPQRSRHFLKTEILLEWERQIALDVLQQKELS